MNYILTSNYESGDIEINISMCNELGISVLHGGYTSLQRYQYSNLYKGCNMSHCWPLENRVP